MFSLKSRLNAALKIFPVGHIQDNLKVLNFPKNAINIDGWFAHSRSSRRCSDSAVSCAILTAHSLWYRARVGLLNQYRSQSYFIFLCWFHCMTVYCQINLRSTAKDLRPASSPRVNLVRKPPFMFPPEQKGGFLNWNTPDLEEPRYVSKLNLH